MTEEELRKLIPEEDADFLMEKEFQFDVTKASDGIHVMFADFELPSTYTPQRVTLRVILPSGYPSAKLDMFWMKPWVKISASQSDPSQCSHRQVFAPDPEEWQRWSRHTQDKWRPGVDNLRSYIATIRRELTKGI